jgi:hypothetical protein
MWSPENGGLVTRQSNTAGLGGAGYYTSRPGAAPMLLCGSCDRAFHASCGGTVARVGLAPPPPSAPLQPPPQVVITTAASGYGAVGAGSQALAL